MEKNRSFVIDSNVIIAFYDDNDFLHTKALEIAKEVANKTIYLHPYVIQETSTILTYKFGSVGAKRFLDNLTNSENIAIPFLDVKEEITFFLNLNKKISFTDSTLIKLSKEKGIPLLTFDKQIISILRNLK